MKRMGTFQKFGIGAALISALFMILVGCSGQVAAKKGEVLAARKGEHREAMATHHSSEMDAKTGDLIIHWGDNRKLKMTELATDLKANLPGGGGKDANGDDIHVVMVTFYRSDGTAFVADMSGREITPCAQVVNGKFVPLEGQKEEDMCPNLFKTKITGIQKVTINTSKSPDCPIDIWCNYAIQRCR